MTAKENFLANPHYSWLNLNFELQGYQLSAEDLKKWLSYNEHGVKPARYKLEAIVYSDQALETSVYFRLNGFELTLKPLQEANKNPSEIEGLIPAFYCEVISSQESHRGGNNFDLHECLDRVLPVVGFKYRLSLSYSQWEEYEGEWVKAIGGGGRLLVQTTHKEIPNRNLHEIIEAYEVASKRTDKRSKKAAAIRGRLKEALELEAVSKRFSFLSYYNIIEIVSDDLASNNSNLSEDPVAADIARFSLSTRGSQRTKIYFLLRSIENCFDIKESIELADVRNDLAHGELSVNQDKLDLCKKIAFWASEKFVLEIAK